MRTLAIVGAGFCGSMVATHVLRASHAPFDRVVLVERNGREIGGVAYGTPSTSHTLNVPAGRMSAFEDDADDFLRFVRAADPALTGGSFVPRRLYGEYLAQTLAAARAASRVPLFRVAGEATRLAERPDGVTLELLDGRRLDAAQVVLAVGNYPPSDPPAADDGLYRSIRYARDPWAPDALEAARDQPVLLVGTGLTMCDVALALRDADQAAPIVAVSRRGLLPQPHRVSPKPPPHLDPPAGMERGPRPPSASSAGCATRWTAPRARGSTGARSSRRSATTRPHCGAGSATTSGGASCGTCAPTGRRTATARHPRRRSRSRRWSSRAPCGSSRAASSRYAESDGGVTVRYATRTGGSELEVGKVINCTGPNTNLAEVRDPLVRGLRDAGLIRPDALGLGLDTDEEGRLLDAAGRPSERLSLAGPLRKGLCGSTPPSPSCASRPSGLPDGSAPDASSGHRLSLDVVDVPAHVRRGLRVRLPERLLHRPHVLLGPGRERVVDRAQELE